MASTLSKSKYLAGLQCPRRLWLACHQPELGTSPSAGLSASFDEGAEIGRRARELFAGGVVVDDAAWGDGEAMARTRQLLADPQVGAIFEAAFEHAGVRVRVDVLERLPDGAWGLREVKASTRVRDVHLHDVAVQRFVVEGAGVRLDSVEVMHVEPDYVRGDAGIDWHRFFRRTDVNAETTALLPDVPARVAALQRVLELPAAPVVEPGFHCFEPYGCDFWSHCTAGKPADWVFRLPWLDADVCGAPPGRRHRAHHRHPGGLPAGGDARACANGVARRRPARRADARRRARLHRATGGLPRFRDRLRGDPALRRHAAVPAGALPVVAPPGRRGGSGDPPRVPRRHAG